MNRIMILEDDVINALVLKEFLHNDQTECHITRDPEQAMSMLLDCEYNYVFVDIDLSSQNDGLDFVKLAKSHFNNYSTKYCSYTGYTVEQLGESVDLFDHNFFKPIVDFSTINKALNL